MKEPPPAVHRKSTGHDQSDCLGTLEFDLEGMTHIDYFHIIITQKYDGYWLFNLLVSFAVSKEVQIIKHGTFNSDPINTGQQEQFKKITGAVGIPNDCCNLLKADTGNQIILDTRCLNPDTRYFVCFH